MESAIDRNNSGFRQKFRYQSSKKKNESMYLSVSKSLNRSRVLAQNEHLNAYLLRVSNREFARKLELMRIENRSVQNDNFKLREKLYNSEVEINSLKEQVRRYKETHVPVDCIRSQMNILSSVLLQSTEVFTKFCDSVENTAAADNASLASQSSSQPLKPLVIPVSLRQLRVSSSWQRKSLLSPAQETEEEAGGSDRSFNNIAVSSIDSGPSNTVDMSVIESTSQILKTFTRRLSEHLPLVDPDSSNHDVDVANDDWDPRRVMTTLESTCLSEQTSDFSPCGVRRQTFVVTESLQTSPLPTPMRQNRRRLKRSNVVALSSDDYLESGGGCGPLPSEEVLTVDLPTTLCPQSPRSTKNNHQDLLAASRPAKMPEDLCDCRQKNVPERRCEDADVPTASEKHRRISCGKKTKFGHRSKPKDSKWAVKRKKSLSIKKTKVQSGNKSDAVNSSTQVCDGGSSSTATSSNLLAPLEVESLTPTLPENVVSNNVALLSLDVACPLITPAMPPKEKELLVAQEQRPRGRSIFGELEFPGLSEECQPVWPNRRLRRRLSHVVYSDDEDVNSSHEEWKFSPKQSSHQASRKRKSVSAKIEKRKSNSEYLTEVALVPNRIKAKPVCRSPLATVNGDSMEQLSKSVDASLLASSTQPDLGRRALRAKEPKKYTERNLRDKLRRN